MASDEATVRSLYVQAASRPWEPLYPGVEIKTLHQDEAQKLHVMLMRYAPGAVIPKHRHSAIEHIFVLEGSVEDEFGACTAGNYALRPPGCVHAPGSRGGAVALAISYGPTVRIDA
jgi:anti-sigma factor ChrR (cupin superfamily)